jgi:hypothetical protein
MPYEIVQRRSSGLSRVEQREQSREIEAVYHDGQLAEQRVAGINRVTQRAMVETMRTSELRKIAEQIAPDGAELYAMIAVAGAVETTRVISGMNQPRRYR